MPNGLVELPELPPHRKLPGRDAWSRLEDRERWDVQYDINLALLQLGHQQVRLLRWIAGGVVAFTGTIVPLIIGSLIM